MAFFLCLSFFTPPLLAIDEIFNFEEQVLPEVIEFETERKLCFFPYKNVNGTEDISYLSEGIPSVLYSGFNKTRYVFDKDVMPLTIFHSHGKQYKLDREKFESFHNREFIEALNFGRKKLTPEKDPRFIQLKPVLISSSNPLVPGMQLSLGKKHECFYLVGGEYYQTEANKIQIQTFVFERRYNRQKNFTTELSLKRLFQEIEPHNNDIRKYLINREEAGFSIQTGKEKNALVYIDGVYMGKTPAEDIRVTEGIHSLEIQKEGFEKIKKVYSFEKKKKYNLVLELKPLKKEGFISVKSEPEGADVYLGSIYLGKTPLKEVQVPLGLNRLRIEKEGFVTHFEGINISKGKTNQIATQLSPGESKAFYQNQFHIFLDHDYYDFTLYSLSAALMFYGGYMYGQYRVSSGRDQLRTEVRLNMLNLYSGIANFSNLSQSSQSEYTTNFMYEQMKIIKNESKIKNWENLRDRSAILGGGMIIGAFTFLWLGHNHEGFEFGQYIEEYPGGKLNARSTLGFRLRF
ncbi:MAG: PEGA domain-containing protein [Leptospiraceae bacterium]|nr:PEGA domain-containing protein [Leptospiraceae bacterium]